MRKSHLCIGAFISILVLSAGNAQAQTTNAANHKGSIALQGKASAAAPPAVGSGTAGQLTKWVGNDGSSFTIGDSIITESKLGLIGIGTTTPTSKLTVQGVIETKYGGLKFPDGTIQTTAGIGSIFHDTSLAGSGTSGMPLQIAVPLSLTGSSSVPTITAISTGKSFGFGVDGVFAVGGAGGSALRGGRGVKATGGAGAAGSTGGEGVLGLGGAPSELGTGGIGVSGIGGQSPDAAGGDGVQGQGGSTSFPGGRGGNGVRSFGGFSTNGIGGIGMWAEGGSSGQTTGGVGVLAAGGSGSEGGIGVLAFGGGGFAPQGLAGKFDGNVTVTGTLAKGAGSFKIDHPLDPENKYLYHSFVESPDMMNLYNGKVTTDGNGDAVITLPDWFETLNRDFRYQLTVIGTFAQAIVGSEIAGNHFAIRTSAPNVKVSWQVTGVRQDAYAKAHRIVVEENKPEKQRGFYLHPDAFNQPEEKSIEWALHPELMKDMKEKRELRKQDQRHPQTNQ